MARLPAKKKHTKTALAMFDAIASRVGDWRRPHLGCSQIGKECSRAIWYSFRWAVDPWRAMADSYSLDPLGERHPGQLSALFQRGNREEQIVIKYLGWAGITIDHWSDRLKVRFGGHLSGTLDGIGIGFPEAPKTEHVWDCKTASDKQFKIFRRVGLRKWHPEYWAQAQLYMRGTGLKRAIYTVVNKNDDDMHSDRIHYDRAEATRLEAKGHEISLAPEPPTRISDDPTWWQCKFCDHRSHCHGAEPERIERNCRTCAHVTPIKDGTWRCSYHECEVTVETQRDGCSHHLLIPALLPWQPEEDGYDEQAGTMTYETRDGSRVVDNGTTLEPRP